MARQQTQSSKDNDPGCQVWTGQESSCAYVRKGPLDHEIGDLRGQCAFLITKPRTHCITTI